MGNPGKRATRRRQTKQKQNTQCVGHHYSQTNKNNINKKMRPPTEVKTSQHGTPNVNTHNMTTYKNEKMSNMELTKKPGDELRCSRRISGS
jgi:hypothetical protein